MFCPRCSQEQISDDIKFCSRCGFPLTDVAEALQNNGTVERNVIQSTKDLKIATIKGIIIMILAVKFVLLSLVFGSPEPSFFVQFNLLVGILFFLFGMGLIAYNFWLKPAMLQKKSEREVLPNDSRKSFSAAQTTGNLLNEPDLSQVASYAPPQKGVTTNDLAVPVSVVEETTKQLRSDKK
jgi:hypothetical protein